MTFLEIEMANRRQKLKLLLFSIVAVISAISSLSCISVKSQPPPEINQEPVPEQPVVKPPTIVVFEVSPTKVTAVEPVILRWEVTGATKATIDQNIGQVPLSGTRKLIPSKNVTYLLTAINAGGSVTRTAAVTVYENVYAVQMALTEDDVKESKFYSAQNTEPKIDDTISTYSIKFTRRGYIVGGDEILDNTVLIFNTVAAAEKYYIQTKSNARETILGIANIGDEGYVMKLAGDGENDPARYIIRFHKNNVYVNVGMLSIYQELESFAKIVESKIH
jgi:hypothetical protein